MSKTHSRNSRSLSQPPNGVWESFVRRAPAWFLDAKLGIFIHWGAYSVPAWAEPLGELGTIDEQIWFRHNPYAEWYWNTIRFADSPARAHHRSAFGDSPYDQFLDAWGAEQFDAREWATRIAGAGARYVVLTTKHHDGIALWDAPGTGERNTVHRGPRRDIVKEVATAVRERGMRFGAYYSGGLDWSVTDFPPIETMEQVRERRPNDPAYAAYAHLHIRDLIDRHEPDLLWNDIEWPDAGKHGRSLGLAELLEHYYATVPDGLVNDRWGETHWDFKTSEYQEFRESESAVAWENCRGIGFSFGYNAREGSRHLISPQALIRHFVDVVSRGGNLLLNVGPTASGVIPSNQSAVLDQLGSWLRDSGDAIYASRRLPTEFGSPTEDPWVRWTYGGGKAWAIIDAHGEVVLSAQPDRFDLGSAQRSDGKPLHSRKTDAGLAISLESKLGLPVAVSFDLR